MKVREFLSKDEVIEYKKSWVSFSGKYNALSEHEVHSGMPVIGEIFQFQDRALFRTHIFQNKLRGFNPYFISDKYFHPFWHAQHYFTVMEQLYHAGSNKLRDNSKLVVKDIPERFKWRKPTFWDNPTSAELILEDLGTKGKYYQERACFTFYDDKKGRPISEIDVTAFYQPRAYIRDMEAIRKGDQKALEKLLRRIKHQAICHRQMTKPRKKLISSEKELVEKLRSGEIPEKKLHDFFSFWDKP